MNKILKWGLAGSLACTWMGAAAQTINPMTEAVMRNYAEILAEDPQDYMTLYDRASQYLELGEYDRALSDIEMALEYTPEKDKDYRIAEYALKSEVLTAKKDYMGALDAVNSALALNPVSQPNLYKAGNLFLMLKNPEGALKAFEALQRENPRSQEAFYGMAKANVMAGRNDDAEKLIAEIESLGKQSFITYCRIGDLYSDMGNVRNAATNYTIAYTMDDNSNRPLASLKVLAAKEPDTVMKTIDEMISSKPDNIALNYLKAIIAFDGGLYAQAETACSEIAKAMDKESPAVYRMQAMSQLAQNKLQEAAQSIKAAETLAPGDPGVLLDKAEIYLTTNPAESYEAAKKALTIIPDNEAALMAASKGAIMTGNYNDALAHLNEIVLSNPGNIDALLLRGYVNSEFLKEGKAGVADYTRAGNVNPEGNVAAMTKVALGKAKTNKKLDADGIINEAVQRAGNNKEDLYAVAVYYAQTGNLEKAKEFADKAILNGYGNIYNLRTNDEPLFNLKPIRHLTGK